MRTQQTFTVWHTNDKPSLLETVQQLVNTDNHIDQITVLSTTKINWSTIITTQVLIIYTPN